MGEKKKRKKGRINKCKTKRKICEIWRNEGWKGRKK